MGKIDPIWVNIGIFNLILLQSKSNTLFLIDTRNIGA